MPLQPVPRPPNLPSPIRGALIAGFAVVFALWLASGYQLIASIREAEARRSIENASFLQGEQVLTTITTRVLLGSIYLRDALISPTPDVLNHYAVELAQLRKEVDQIIPRYTPLVDTREEREQWTKLQAELDAYWKSREIVFAIQQGTVGTTAQLIASRVVPARESILQLVNSLSDLERATIASHQQQAERFFQEAQQRAAWLAAIALVAALCTAFIAARHVGRLEREIGRRQRAEHQNRLDLERLSARLVNAQEEERRSLARELHDAVGQALTAIKMEMGVALRGVEADARARAALEQARAIAESTLQSVRDLSQVLHPSMLDDFGLPEAVRAHLRAFSQRTDIRAQLIHERMTDRLPADVEVCVYRIVQEALTNVARHSGATSCTVSLIRRENVLQLTVEDDGHGLAPTTARTPDARRGLGLIGMRERAQNLAGTFIIENRPEGGTRVVVKLPVPPVVEANRQEQLAG
jgi:signal transduction histidine kinase